MLTAVVFAASGTSLEEVATMSRSDDEGIFVRTDVWLIVGQRAPVRVKTRTLSEDGVFLEFTGPLRENEVEVIFDDAGTHDGESHKIGKVVQRWPDGISVRFNRRLRSASELLMRNSLVQTLGKEHKKLAGFGH
jgi:hypothetical protein